MRAITRNAFQIGAIAALLATLGCTSPAPDAESEGDRPRVVSTSTIIADFAEDIGADEIRHEGILEPGADPHVYEPVPADSQALENADLILYNGYNLEPALIRLIDAAGEDAKKLAVGEVVEPLDYDYEGQIVPDPHVWGDVERAIEMVNGIRDALIEISPEDREIFTANAKQLTEELQQLDSWIEAQIQTIPESQRQLVTTHDAFQYYARAYGLEITGTLIGISTEEQPSAQTMKRLVERVKAVSVPTIFAETTLNPQLIKTVAQEAGVKFSDRELYSDSIGAPGSEGDSYLNMMVWNTRAIVDGLGGEVTEFPGS